MAKVVILLGAPGSGKGTIAKVLNNTYLLPHISTGDLLREEVANKTALGLQVNNLMANGILVNDEITTNILQARINNADCKNGFVLDGYPRNTSQLELLNIIFKDLNINKVYAIQIDMEEDIIKKRIAGRYSCATCGKIYNEFWVNPKIKDVCDDCGNTNFTKRPDDNLDVISKRLNVFKEQTLPIIEYYKKLNLLYSIRGDLNEAEIKQWFNVKLK